MKIKKQINHIIIFLLVQVLFLIPHALALDEYTLSPQLVVGGGFFGEAYLRLLAQDEARLSRQEQEIFTQLFDALEIDLNSLAWDTQGNDYDLSEVPVADINEDTLREMFCLPFSYKIGGTLGIIRYQNFPILIYLCDQVRNVTFIDLTKYYRSSFAANLGWGIKQDICIIFKRKNFFKVSQIEITHPYVTVAINGSGDLAHITEYDFSDEEADVFPRRKIELPLLPGVWMPKSTSSYLIAEATAEFVRPGMRVLVIGTGAGLEARIAAEKGALVDAVDIKKLAVRNTKLTCSEEEYAVRVNAFVNNMFHGLGKYDLIIWNMPHFVGTEEPKEDFPDYSNSSDFTGKILREFAQNVCSHLKKNGKAVVINKSDEQVKQILEYFSGKHVEDYGVSKKRYSQGYIIDNQRVKRWKKMRPFPEGIISVYMEQAV
ncbi:MAG: methyltransferase [Candidatus Omnitrophota bacterium]